MEASSHLIAIVHERGKELHQLWRHRDDIRQCEKNYHLEGFFLRSKGIFFFAGREEGGMGGGDNFIC